MKQADPDADQLFARTHAVLGNLQKSLGESRRDKMAEIRELASLLHEIDGIPRVSVWSAEDKQRIAAAQDFMCPECGLALPPITGGGYEVDHKIPWAYGGGNELPNMQILHAKCNRSKSARYDADELLDYIEDRLRNI